MQGAKLKLTVAGTVCCLGWLLYAGASLANVAAPKPSQAKPDKKPPKPEPVPNQLLVSFKSGASSSDIAALHGRAKGKVLKKISRIGVELVELPAGSNVADAIKAYKKNSNVAFAEPNYRRTLTTTEGSLPAPYNVANNFTEQWHLHNTGQGFGAVCSLDYENGGYVCDAPAYWGVPDADIDAPEGWDLTHGSLDIKIAILDSGVECSHPDLSGKCVEQINFADGCSNADDYIGHGTHVASIAAAKTNNETGTAGVAWEPKIGSLKVCAEVELLPGYYYADCRDGDLAEAIIYAADQGYQVINMSLAGPENSAVIRNAVEYAWSRGAVLVAGAGNNYDMIKQYPAGYDNVISVAATDHYDNLADFSTFGKDWVSVAAPGGFLSVLLPDISRKGTMFAAIPALYCSGNPDCYDWKSGTSMATPVVAGIAAMVWSYIPDPTNVKVRECIEISAQKSGALGQNFLAWTKHGRVNLYNALQCISPDQNVPPTALFNSTIVDLKVDFTDRSFDKGGTVAAWNWDFGDGGTSTEQNPSHTYTAAGKYTVKLTVTDNGNEVSTQFTNDVEVSSDPETCVDADGDGVPDANDKCENTPANTPVNSKGCPAKPKVVVVPIRG
ncbi:S8 family serine peptidase [Desulfobulbus sp. F3]|nr:S8 family serine peptidase [Desulfobulbus sp. F3]